MSTRIGATIRRVVRRAIREGGLGLREWVFDPLCWGCEAPVARPGEHCVQCASQISRVPCVRCSPASSHVRPPRPPDGVDRVIAWGSYRGVLRQAILDLKFGGQSWRGTLLGDCLLAAHRTCLDGLQVSAVLPVPLSRQRLGEREFNQSIHIARPIALALGVPLMRATLRRVVERPPQSRISRVSARRENVDGVFEVSVTRRLRGAHVMLIDDVMTTGATASACAKVLKAAGASAVSLACVAIAAPGADVGTHG